MEKENNLGIYFSFITEEYLLELTKLEKENCKTYNMKREYEITYVL